MIIFFTLSIISNLVSKIQIYYCDINFRGPGKWFFVLNNLIRF